VAGIEPTRRLKVLLSYRAYSDGGNPYTALLSDALETVVSVTHFSWRRALFGSYDVLHVHWPEQMIVASRRGLAVVKCFFALILLLRLSLFDTKVVHTRHNRSPHEPVGFFARFFIRSLDRRSSREAVMSESELQQGRDQDLIKHGTYADWFDSCSSPGRIHSDSLESAEMQLLFFGLVRNYKQVPELVKVLRQSSIERFKFIVMGLPGSRADRADVLAAVGDDSRFELRLKRFSDSELCAAAELTDVVVLPYRDPGNSGAVLTALALCCPVVVSDSASMREIQMEVGPAWLQVVSRLEDVAEAVDSLRSSSAMRVGGPRFSGRDWTTIAQQHLAFYLAACSEERSPCE